MISFLAGKPNAATFPFESITLNLKSPVPFQHASDNGKANGHSEEITSIDISGPELDEALQYGATSGLPALIKWMESFQAFAHHRNKENENWRMSVGVGSQDCLSKAFQALVDDGDSVLFESPAYSGTMGAISPTHAELIEVECTSEGLDPVHLEHVLSNWESDYPGKSRPRILYTIPMGSNPTGYSIPEHKKVQILRLVKQYNLLLLEDDAYAFVYYGPANAKSRSYFALEPEVNGEAGRVVRFDSFSKILSSGMRLGFTTGQKALLDRIDLITANTHLQTPSTTQMIAFKLLQSWGPEGLMKHCAKVAQFYKQQRDMFEAAAQKHLTGVADWSQPVAGMFLWIKLHLHEDGTEGDSFAIVRTKAVEKGVLAVPGASFMPRGGKSPCVRVSFSLATPEQADLGFQRLREVIDDVRAGR
ncbi:hypothetical protein EMMF5_005996 [Cystobasidiomycetes sp. EMM_F5]